MLPVRSTDHCSSYGAAECKASAEPVCSTEDKEHQWYRPDVDGLRAVAVTAVILYHMNTAWLPGGFTGVDIFFVISGFVVTGSVLRHKSSNDTLNDCFTGFYARRAKRIAPAAITVLLVSSLCMSVVVPPFIPNLKRHYITGMYAIVGMANNYLSTLRSSYFDDVDKDAEINPFQHTWSLGVEEQFYFVFPFLMVAAYGSATLLNGGAAMSANTHTQKSAAVWGTCIILSLLLSAALTYFEPQYAFYTLPSRLWELALGAFLFDIRAPLTSIIQNQGVHLAVQVTAVVCISLGLALTPKSSGFPFPWALVSIFGTACYITAGYSPRSYLNGFFSGSVPVFIGKISYSLYLWHWPVLAILQWVFERGTVEYYIVSFLAFTIMSIVAHFGVERPCMRWQPKQKYLVFVVLFVAVGIAEVWFFFLQRGLESSEPMSLYRNVTASPKLAHLFHRAAAPR